MLSLFLLAGPVVVLGGAAGPVPAHLEGERRNDERMWGLMRQMLVEFGYQEKAVLLDTAWQKTNTPQQWATYKQEHAALTNRAVAAAPSPEVLAVVKSCQAAAAGGFADVLAAACKTSQNVAHITGGLVLWTQQGGKPLLQGQADKALHFIYGAYLEATLGKGNAGAVVKEQYDAQSGRPFDCDDMAASFAGAEWVRQAQASAGWIEQWASGGKTLATNLPTLHYGTGNQSPQYAAQIQLAIRNSYNW